MKLAKIYVIACLHGDESFGLKILNYLKEFNNTAIITVLGHPEAVAKKKEYLQTDLNRSFGYQRIQSKETYLAKAIQANIDAKQPDLIIDLHTADAKVGKVAILSKKRSSLIKIAKHLGMEQVVVMPRTITRKTLIGQYPQRSLALELGKGYRSDSLAKTIATKINQLTETAHIKDSAIPIYFIHRTIKKKEAEGAELINYTFHESLGGYPFLVGKNSYVKYAGFLARRKI